MSDKPKAPSSLADLIWVALNAVFKRDAVMALVLLAGGGGAVVLAQTRVETAVREKVDAGISQAVLPLQVEQRALKERLDGVADDVALLKRNAEAVEQRNADRFEVLYRTILSGQPSRKAEELARPAPIVDGGR